MTVLWSDPGCWRWEIARRTTERFVALYIGPMVLIWPKTEG